MRLRRRKPEPHLPAWWAEWLKQWEALPPEQQAAVRNFSPAPAPTCSCYPGGFTPDTYEGPQASCAIHGQSLLTGVRALKDGPTRI